jgi:hypothetical protein
VRPHRSRGTEAGTTRIAALERASGERAEWSVKAIAAWAVGRRNGNARNGAYDDGECSEQHFHGAMRSDERPRSGEAELLEHAKATLASSAFVGRCVEMCVFALDLAFNTEAMGGVGAYCLCVIVNRGPIRESFRQPLIRAASTMNRGMARSTRAFACPVARTP